MPLKRKAASLSPLTKSSAATRVFFDLDTPGTILVTGSITAVKPTDYLTPISQ